MISVEGTVDAIYLLETRVNLYAPDRVAKKILEHAIGHLQQGLYEHLTGRAR